MSCSCIRGVYDFHAKAVDTEKIVYKDLSDWMDEDNYLYPEKYTVYVTPPGTSKKQQLELFVNSTNNIQSFGKLKDGIYCFETTSCGVTYKKSVALFPNLECCLKQAWATLGEESIPKIEDIESFKKMAEINAEFNNVKAAAYNLDIAQKLLRNLKCDCSC